LIAKEIEKLGIPTICLSSALSITRSVHPPRAAFIDYPLGHTAGKPHDLLDQETILRKALLAIEEITSPGQIIDLGLNWTTSDEWKDSVMRASDAAPSKSSDDRVARFDTPQYQTTEDAGLADLHCPTCVFLKDSDKGI